MTLFQPDQSKYLEYFLLLSRIYLLKVRCEEAAQLLAFINRLSLQKAAGREELWS